jgi:1-acyl-sn-glycerol-3-phosphate acyltransferase
VENWNLKPARDLDLPLMKRLGSTRREPGLVEGIGNRLWASVNWAYFRAWHRLGATGRGNLPRDLPFIMIANHASHLDALILAAVLPWRLRRGVFTIAAGDAFFVGPVWTTLSAVLLNALPMWRRKVVRHDLETLRTRIVEDGCGYILFPEGTRPEDGRMVRFKSGLGMLIAGTPIPVVPCHIRGAYESLSRDQRFPRPRRITVTIGPPITFADLSNDRDGWESVARRAEDAVRGLQPPAA